MQSLRSRAWVPLRDSQSAIPPGSTWLGHVDPTDVVTCVLRVRPAPRPDLLRANEPPAARTDGIDSGGRSTTGLAPAAPVDFDRVRTFIHQTSLTIVALDPQHRAIVLSGSAAAVADTFRVRLARYKAAGRVHLGSVTPISVPIALAGVVEHISGFDDSPREPVAPARAFNETRHFIKYRVLIPLLVFGMGVALAVVVSGVLTSDRSTSSPPPAPRPPQGLLPSLQPPTQAMPRAPRQPALALPPAILRSLQKLETAGWQSLEAGRLQEAQDYFLRALAEDPTRAKAMQGLVAVQRQLGGDDPRVIQKQIVKYEGAIQRGGTSGEYLTPSALRLLVSANLRALRESEAQGGRTGRSSAAPAQGGVPNLPGPPPTSRENLTAGKPLHTAANSNAPSPRPTQAPPAQPTNHPPKPRSASTAAPTAEIQKPPPAMAPQPTPQDQTPGAAPSPERPTTAPAAGLYTVRIGPVSDDRATAIASQLSAGGFSRARLGTESGYRVVSEPLPRKDAASLVSGLSARGIRGYIGPITGETVQIVFGAFTSRTDAEALSSRLTAAGYKASVRAATVYTLRVGPYPSSAVSAITEIVKSGVPEAAVVADPVP
jgi:SPOR domain/Pro-kumamolisin, activation domain